MKDIFYFGRQPEPTRTSSDSKFREFIVQCLRCGSFKVNVVGQFDGEGGEMRIAFICLGCGRREEVPIAG